MYSGREYSQSTEANSTWQKRIHELPNENTSIVTKHNVHNYLVSPKQNGFLKFSLLIIKFIRLLFFPLNCINYPTLYFEQDYIFTLHSTFIHQLTSSTPTVCQALHLISLIHNNGLIWKKKKFSLLKEKKSYKISQTMKWKYEFPHQNLKLQCC